MVADALYGTMNMRSMGAMGLLTLFFLILLPLITTTYTTSGLKEAGAQPLQVNNTLTLSLPELYSNVEDSVVAITATTAATAGNDTTAAGNETSPFEIEESLIGSGFIYDNGGHIITGYSLLVGTNPDDINITFSDGTIYGARVIGTDAYSDLAVLRLEDEVPADKLVPLPLGNSTALKIGEQVATIGHPFGLVFGALTAGTVAQMGVLLPGAVDNTSSGPEFSIADTIAADLPVSDGNFGGPLFNMEGEVVGITVAIIDPTSISLSIPSNAIAKIAPVLIERGFFEHPWLGVSGLDMTPEIAEAIGLVEPRGFLVTETAPSGPADTAGVQGGNVSTVVGVRDIDLGGDVILAINDHDIRKIDDILVYLEQATQVGETVTLTVWRNGQIIDIDVTVGSRPSLQGSALAEDNATATAVQEEDEQQQQQPLPQEEEWLLYENATYGVRMFYPSAWTQQDGTVIEEGFVFVSDFSSPEEADGSFAAVSIGIDNMPPSTNLEDSLNETVNNLMQGDASHQIISSNTDNFTLAGMPAYSLETTYTDPQFGPQRMLFVETIVDNNGYSIWYIAEPHIYQKHLPIVETTISSLELRSEMAVLDAPTTEPTLTEPPAPS